MYKGRTIQSYQKSADNAQEALWVHQENYPDGERYLAEHERVANILVKDLDIANENLRLAKEHRLRIKGY